MRDEYSGKRTRIALVTLNDPTDIRSWSGIPYYIAQALERNIGEVDFIGPIFSKTEKLGSILNMFSNFIFRKKFDYRRAPFIAKRYGRILAKRLSKKNYDVIVVPAASSAIAYLTKPEIPIVLIADATFAGMNEYYKGFSGYLEISIKHGHNIASKALKKADYLAYSSKWAADSAIQDYGVDPSKVRVIPFGANIDEVPQKHEALNRTRSGECRLLFIGVDWDRKGGPIAFDTIIELEKLFEIKAHLTVCGCVPPDEYRHPRMKVIGFLNKSQKEDLKKMVRLLNVSDYLFLPTRNECFGVVFCEASAYGLPSVSCDTGGVSGAVSDGINGLLLPENAGPVDYAKRIFEFENNPDKYNKLVKTTRELYDERLNWDAWAIALKNWVLELR